MTPTFGKGKFLGGTQIATQQQPVSCGSKSFIEIALSSTVFEIQAFLCFAFLKKKFENSKWPPFLASEIFVETWKG